MHIPCRRCTDENGGVEVTKPLSAFTVCSTQRELWKNILSRGQDLSCIRCMVALGGACPKSVVTCDGCGATQARRFFDAEELNIWNSQSKDTILCRSSCWQKYAYGWAPAA